MDETLPTVEDVVREGLCLGCGTCYNACSVNAITFELNEMGFYVPKVEHDICTRCGVCYKACPGLGVDITKMNLRTFSRIPRNPYLGSYINTYIGYAKDSRIRYLGSSGGVATALSMYVLDKGIVDGAIVVRMKRLRAETFIAKSKDEVLHAIGSKYQPIPVNVAIKEIIRSKENRKYLLIGLPCHIHGILKLEECFPQVRERIAYRIGLFCSGQPSILGTLFILWRYKIPVDEVKKITYRSGGWPGELNAELLSGEKIRIPLPEYWPYMTYFINPRCRLCIDHTAEFADISLGDPWLKNFYDPVGSSIIIARTTPGERLLKNAEKDGIIALRKINWMRVFESQFDAIMFKKADLPSRRIAIPSRKVPKAYIPSVGYPKILTLNRIITYNIASLFAFKRRWGTLNIYHKVSELNLKLFWLYLHLLYSRLLNS